MTSVVEAGAFCLAEVMSNTQMVYTETFYLKETMETFSDKMSC